MTEPILSPATPSTSSRRIKLFACEIFYRELCACAARSTNIVDLEFVTQGLHDLRAERMAARLQEKIDAVPADRYTAIVLGLALCNNGVVGLSHPTLPLVIPRAHDCIALFFGSRSAYDAYFSAEPGTYFKTSGWIERDHENLEEIPEGEQSAFGALRTFEEYCEKYGEENARYIMETMGGLHNYTRMAYIDMPGIAPLPYDKETRHLAEKTGLRFDRAPGSLGWLQRLTDGPWDEQDFLLCPPGHRIAASHDEQILIAVE